ncbi:hypothetical protein [Nodularia sp. LEGE 04288]|uniref:hypothetical protein n=1 Tax=Nodularia sp. LEGE 04288 TaxID=1828639 RepID=UPI001D12D84F|nr:hypothetical protein [Nodularia sp. LEGE 04288]MCC2692813.1 hypothetical protein [Nodularia sp. LEGE 04288]
MPTVAENGIENVLHHIINRLSALDASQVHNTSSVENRLQQIETMLGHLSQRIEYSIESTSPQQQAQQPSHLSQKLETVTKSLAQINHTLGQMWKLRNSTVMCASKLRTNGDDQNLG